MGRNDGNSPKKNKPKNFDEQAVSSKAYPRKNYKVNFKKDNKNQRKEEQRKRPPTVNADSGKTKPFIAKKPEGKYGAPYEYKMSKLCANEILKECPSRIKPQQYLCDFVTEQYGLLGWCCKVIVEG